MMTLQAEIQTCPRRMSEMGPWEYKEGLDAWRSDRWTDDLEAAARDKVAYEAEHPGSYAADHGWRGPGTKPRTCSFCGGAHPEDVIALIKAGWVTERTDKNYKVYLHPPGFRDQRSAEGGPAWTPTPPLKVYMQHFSEDQCNRANEANAAIARNE